MKEYKTREEIQSMPPTEITTPSEKERESEREKKRKKDENSYNNNKP